MAKTQILIVEDDGIIAMDIEHRLKSLGYSVSGIVNYGEKAIEKVEELNPDLVLMDIVLKGEMDGIQAAEIIRSRFDIPVIFLTAYADEERFERAKLTIPFGYILKPFQDKDLKITIEIALHIAKIDAKRKQAEESLRESKEELRTIVDSAPIQIWYKDKDNKIMRVNQAGADAFGKRIEDIEGKPAKELFPEADAIHYYDDDLEVINSGKPKSNIIEEMQITSGERRYVCTDKVPYMDKNGKINGVIAFVRDITENKRAEKEKERLESQLQQAQKMEAIGTLAGGIAHDFNNILGIIIGGAELSLQDIKDEELIQSYLTEVLKAANRAKDLVRQILTFSRQNGRNQIPLMPVTIIKETLKLLRASLPATIEIHQSIQKDSGMILADPTQIHQILMNLSTNAAHAMGEKSGILSISLNDVDIDPQTAAQHPDMPAGPYVKMTVSDTGHGIESEIIGRIFEPYFTTKGVGEGTGLGLSVVHGIVHNHGGTLTVNSEPGKGTTFDIFFPRIVQTEGHPRSEKIIDLPIGNERILFVDDEKAILRIGEQIAKSLGYEVFSLTSSIEALDTFRDNPNKFDLIITDMTMPHMTGRKLSEELMNIRPDIPIILCTGYNKFITEEKAKAIGIQEYLLKPFSKQSLAIAIREVLDTRIDE